ncbi:hypothetical protein TKK_0013614 [Trichogramma kaykai]|uniref:Uncharacterized protein n=1 Tax=Trichogramma kaykai TaxID=54128 RepID=A0ABD2WI85_9HYME
MENKSPNISKAKGVGSGSDYTTCSDNSILHDILSPRQSIILAGHIAIDDSYESYDSDEIGDEAETVRFSAPTKIEFNNEKINILDQNLDVLTEEDEVYADCTADTSFLLEDNSKTDSTEYMELVHTAGLCKTPSFSDMQKSDRFNDKEDYKKAVDFEQQSTKAFIEPNRLVTIMEETEVTQKTNSLLAPESESICHEKNTGKMIVEMVNKIKTLDNPATKKVLFANEDSVINYQSNKVSVKWNQSHKKETMSPHKSQCFSKKRDSNRFCSANHNTTDSFVAWEKYCQSEEKLSLRKSLSFSELNSGSVNYAGDDERSASFKTLDDIYLSHCTLETVHSEKNTTNKSGRLKRRSKSCESLLHEVKHLPHILYNKFLNCLSKEIDKMKKESTKCTCQKPRFIISENVRYIRPRKSNKLTDSKSHQNTKDGKNLLKVSPLQCNRKKSNLSPNSLLNSRQNVKLLSPKSPNASIVTPKKRGYNSWQKEIVSPVGEYIRGKRGSPFAASPRKKLNIP